MNGTQVAVVVVVVVVVRIIEKSQKGVCSL
jgi:hypothetical protein